MYGFLFNWARGYVQCVMCFKGHMVLMGPKGLCVSCEQLIHGFVGLEDLWVYGTRGYTGFMGYMGYMGYMGPEGIAYATH